MPFGGKDPFASLLPDGLKALENEEPVRRANRPIAKNSFPMEDLGEVVSENDVTEDILED